MFELFRIWRKCADDPKRFLGRIIPLVLADARIGTRNDSIARAKHWTDEEQKARDLVTKNPNEASREDFAAFEDLAEFARHTSEILTHVNDKLRPNDSDELAKTRSQAVRDQLFAAAEAAARSEHEGNSQHLPGTVRGPKDSPRRKGFSRS